MDKRLQLLGLAQRAGKVVTGEEAVLRAIRSGQAAAVILAEDASDNTRKRFTDKCSYYDVPLWHMGTRTELGRAIGKPERVVIALTDPGFARAMRQKAE
ncbi:YlxQ family RNA-binding protein [Polycladomyces abyssicola]|jgi:ribosomal protein L7Ae-like RNA K-turn-binding protein|uniref:YlxQ family RNA-binding protein n=1 Tax=Polycladomyces abyssicola TaxID=1125966 RepID=A0A8D5UHJ1_9BACL|nr:YlxQ family RNA-binding protein [Polycladomyces abyssicola]BCU82057.1 YlxQ family RNA-binding protein [Polycladomyces abyssicola]